MPNADFANRARTSYTERLAGQSRQPWWTVVILTAGSARQAARYREEIERRSRDGKLPAGTHYLVVPDPLDQRVGSGGATINALRGLAEHVILPSGCPSLEAWWPTQRVFVIHAGGDSRRLPQYSLSGKLFSALPVRTPWGDVSTVFDETMILSTSWVERLPCGLVSASGDVLLTFDAQSLDWDRPGVTGVAIPQPMETARQHGVYVTDEQGRVYSFLQKPSAPQVRAAGGFLNGETVAVDTGLVRFDPEAAARLTRLAGVDSTGAQLQLGPGILQSEGGPPPLIDLYEHFTMALTGQWRPSPSADSCWVRLHEALHGLPFWCSLVPGSFTHVGTTRSFRSLVTEGGGFTELYEAQLRVGSISPVGMRSAGVVMDSVFSAGGELGPGAVAIECNLDVPVRAARGSILHGLEGLPGCGVPPGPGPVEIPEDTVVHQVPVLMPDGRAGSVVRVYGVEDDPQTPLASGAATWFGRPILEALEMLHLDPAAVWAGVPAAERSLWNAALFPLAPLNEAWACARWIMRFPGTFSAGQWREYEKLSLAGSARWADNQALSEARTRRMRSNWQATAVALARSGTDVRPLLSYSPGITTLAAAARTLVSDARELAAASPTEAASRFFQAALFLGQAGLLRESDEARAAAFDSVRRAVELGASGVSLVPGPARWVCEEVTVSAPPRIDLGGGWSDTPPFCLDWGGTVLNIALRFGGGYPIHATLRRLAEPLIRCLSEETGDAAEYRSMEELLAPVAPGNPFSIPCTALKMTGLFPSGEDLRAVLESCGGGLEIRMAVQLPMGSGLGTSSILAATVIRGLAEMLDVALPDLALSDYVMQLEQLMTTGGGWQDQAGGIFPGAKLVTTGPGLRQRLRVEPVNWTPEREAEFSAHVVLYYTGIRRIAKNLLTQVVGSYLAREVATVQVLHSIKTLAMEMAYALREGEWGYLGQLIQRHWELNQVLDPNTTNAPINALLETVRPYITGAKLAGAGGGGFMMMVARDPDAARELRHRLSHATPLGVPSGPGALYDFEIANQGLLVRKS